MARLCLSKTSLIYWSVHRHGLNILFIILSLSTTSKKVILKTKFKWHITVIRFNRVQESRHHDAIGTQSSQSKLNTQWLILKRVIDGHGHNNDTLGYNQCVEKMYSFLRVLKCPNKWNGRKIISIKCCCKCQVDSVYFRFIDINRTNK